MKLNRRQLRKMILKEMWSKDGNWFHDGTRWLNKSEIKSREFEKQMSRLEGEEGRKRRKQLDRYDIMMEAYRTPVTMDTKIYVDEMNQYVCESNRYENHSALCGAFKVQKDYGWNPGIPSHAVNNDFAYAKITIAHIDFELPVNSDIPNRLHLKFGRPIGSGTPLKELIEYLESEEGGSELAQEILAKVEMHNEKYKDYDPAPRWLRYGPQPAQ